MTAGGRQCEQETCESETRGQVQAQVKQAVREEKCAADVPLDIEFVIEIRFTEGKFARRPEHRPKYTGIPQDHRKPRGLSRLSVPDAAVPQPE
jgi:hypothetical protein